MGRQIIKKYRMAGISVKGGKKSVKADNDRWRADWLAFQPLRSETTEKHEVF